MAKPKFGFVVEYVADIAAAKHFYTDVMGLEVEREHPTYIQFENFAIASDQPMTGSGAQELYWIVDDAEAACALLAEKVEISLPLHQMPFGKVFGIKDPDGYQRLLLEFAPNRPSRPLR